MSAVQERFAQDAARLILKAAELGYGVTLGDAYRTPQQAAANAASGSGIARSLHCERLAIDLNLFKDGRYITDGEGHRELGIWWKSLSPVHRHGGDFRKVDWNHYSLSPDGIRE